MGYSLSYLLHSVTVAMSGLFNSSIYTSSQLTPYIVKGWQLKLKYSIILLLYYYICVCVDVSHQFIFVKIFNSTLVVIN